MMTLSTDQPSTPVDDEPLVEIKLEESDPLLMIRSLTEPQTPPAHSHDDVQIKLEDESYPYGPIRGAGPNAARLPGMYDPSTNPFNIYAPVPTMLTQRYHAPSGAPSQNILPALQPASSYAHNGQVANPGAKMKTEDPLRRRSDSDSDESAGYGSILVKRDQGSLLWSCHQCGKKGMTPKQLREHVRKSHWVPCLSCGTYCKDAKQLQQHYMKMHSIEGLACKICQKVYSTRRKLQIHNRRVHTSNPKYTCDVCNYTARSKYRLQVHQRKHSGVKPLLCVHCGKGYADPSNLNKHIKKAHGHIIRAGSYNYPEAR